MGRRVDLTGQQFGRLTVLEFAGLIGKNGYWYCECECGSWSLVPTHNLKSGGTKSCGCLATEVKRETGRQLGKARLKHGGCMNDSVSTEYRAWMKMRWESDTPYPEEWTDFQKFFRDVGWKPSPEHRLTRKDNRIPHSKENTYWRDPNADNEPTAKPSRVVRLAPVRATGEATHQGAGTEAKVPCQL